MTNKNTSNLTAARLSAGYTIRGLADAVNVNKATIVNIEQGRTSPSIDIMRKIADALSVTLDSLYPSHEEQAPVFKVPTAIECRIINASRQQDKLYSETDNRQYLYVMQGLEMALAILHGSVDGYPTDDYLDESGAPTELSDYESLDPELN